MKTITKTFNIYEFDELNQRAQNKVISDHINFVIDHIDQDSPFYHCVIEMERMQTPWFLPSCINEAHKEDIIEMIKSNDKYMFFENGEIVPVDFCSKKENKNGNA